MARRRKKKNGGGGFWPWATEHWFIAGFILLPAVIYTPVRIVQAMRPLPPPRDPRQPLFSPDR
jgi:hypothetical protein